MLDATKMIARSLYKSQQQHWLLTGKLLAFTDTKDAQGEKLLTQWSTAIIVACS